MAFSRARHDLAAVAWIEAGLSVGSALGGLGYGAVAWRISAQRRLVLLVAGLAVVLIPAALSPDLLVLALLVGLAGVLVSPALSTAYVLVGRLASPRARNRAGNWVNSGYNAGASAGSVVSGQLIGRIPLSACLPVFLAPVLLAVVALLRAQLTPTAEQSVAARSQSGEQRPVGASQTGPRLHERTPRESKPWGVRACAAAASRPEQSPGPSGHGTLRDEPGVVRRGEYATVEYAIVPVRTPKNPQSSAELKGGGH